MKVYGPYKRKDGRLHVVVVSDGIKKTVSYPKFLYENLTGCSLKSHETIDHINGDFTDNRLENLRVLTRTQNIQEYLKTKPKSVQEFVCNFCGAPFKRRRGQVARLLRNKQTGPYCSKICSGKATNKHS